MSDRRAPPDTILSNPSGRTGCGGLPGCESPTDPERRSPDKLPSVGQITGQRSRNDDSPSYQDVASHLQTPGPHPLEAHLHPHTHQTHVTKITVRSDPHSAATIEISSIESVETDEIGVKGDNDKRESNVFPPREPSPLLPGRPSRVPSALQVTESTTNLSAKPSSTGSTFGKRAPKDNDDRLLPVGMDFAKIKSSTSVLRSSSKNHFDLNDGKLRPSGSSRSVALSDRSDRSMHPYRSVSRSARSDISVADPSKSAHSDRSNRGRPSGSKTKDDRSTAPSRKRDNKMSESKKTDASKQSVREEPFREERKVNPLSQHVSPENHRNLSRAVSPRNNGHSRRREDFQNLVHGSDQLESEKQTKSGYPKQATSRHPPHYTKFAAGKAWPGIVTMSLDKKLPTAKKMIIFNNENPLDVGHKFVMANRTFKNWEQVLDEWTKKVRPKFGKVTRVFTPVHGNEVRDMHELRDNGVYIVGGDTHHRKNPRFPPAKRVNSPAVQALFHAEKVVKHANVQFKDRLLVTRSETLPVIDARHHPIQIFPINVFRNADAVSSATRVILKGFDLFNMNLVKDAVGRKVRPLSGAVVSLVTMGGRPVKHVKDLEPNAYYVVLGPGERFSAHTPYRPDGLHEDHVKPKNVRYEAKRPRVKNHRLDDVRRYPISDFLLMSDTSLVDHGFEPIHGEKARHEHGHFDHKPELHRSPPTRTEEELHGPGRPRSARPDGLKKADEVKSFNDNVEGPRIPEIPDSVTLPLNEPNSWPDPR